MIRYPAVAGYFYPSDPEELRTAVEKFLLSARPPKVSGNIIGAIVPHAGYIYSGITAAYVYKILKDLPPKISVVVGPNHTGLGPFISVFPEGEWVTPIGYVDVDGEVSGRIVEQSVYSMHDVEAHLYEHSVEVQYPFFNVIWGDRIRSVPVVMLGQERDHAEDLSNAIPEDVLLIASSDFSHYVPREVAKTRDNPLFERILDLDYRGFLREVERTGATPCGPGPIATLLKWASEQGAEAVFLHEHDSGYVTGDTTNIVHYASFVFVI